MKTCYIVGAGDFFGSFSPEEGDLVIAADGGYEALISHGVRCDLLIGDFDSLGELPEGVETVRYPVKKDDTDSFLAYRLGAQRGYKKFEIYGGVGGRADHTYANLCLLHYAARRGHLATLHGEGVLWRVLVNERATLSGAMGGHLSVFAVGGEARGVTVTGAKYEARDITLTPDFPLGVSNSFTEGECAVEVRDGALLIMHEL